jgi:hypothetical protein
MDEFFAVEGAQVIRGDKATSPTPGVRLYQTQSPRLGAQWALQVWGPNQRANGSDGKDFLAGHAVLDTDAMRKLHDATAKALLASGNVAESDLVALLHGVETVDGELCVVLSPTDAQNIAIALAARKTDDGNHTHVHPNGTIDHSAWAPLYEVRDFLLKVADLLPGGRFLEMAEKLSRAIPRLGG